MVLLRKILFLSTILLCYLPIYGQQSLYPHERIVLDIKDDLNTSPIYQLPKIESYKTPHLSLGIKCRSSDFPHLKIYDEESKRWESLSKEVHMSTNKWSYSELMFFKPGQMLPKLKADQAMLGDVEVHLYNPGNEHSEASRQIDLRSEECPCPQPAILGRDEWCSSCHTDSTPVSNQPNFLIVHHSAGPNSSPNWSAVVRSIWDYHVNGRGWDDIGYNYLIDPDGKIYRGRGDELLGAHFCGTNSGTLGICMIGTYSDVLPSSIALTNLKLFASWQNCKHDIDPLQEEYHPPSNEVLDHLAGHRDGCSTECPGQMLYGLLPEIRQDISFIMDSCGQDTVETDSIMLEGELTSNFTAKLQWSDIPSNAKLVRLEYFNDREENRRSLGIQSLMNQTEILLRPRRRYTFQIRAFMPDGNERVSNEVSLNTGALDGDQIYAVLYPNPFQNELDLAISNAFYGNFSVAIAAFQGFPVFEETYNKEAVLFEKTIDLSFLPPGVYLIYVQHENFSIRSKLIKI